MNRQFMYKNFTKKLKNIHKKNLIYFNLFKIYTLNTGITLFIKESNRI